MKKTRYKNKILISLVALFTMLMCISVGFASWIVTGGSNALALGEIEADDVLTEPTGESVDVITITSIEKYQYAEGYGFVNGGLYSNNVDLTGTCRFDSENAKSCFDSYSNNKSFKLTFELTGELDGGLSSNGFSSTNITLSSSNFSSSSHDTIINDATISTTFTVSCYSNSTDFNFSFSINLKYTGSLSSFPNMGSANLSVNLTPKENTL